MPILSVKDLKVHYGKSEVVKGISFDAEAGTIVTLIGANGAGKTTILRTISGLKSASSGEIWFDGSRIDRESAPQIVKRGLAHIPEGRKVFPSMTVIDNLRMGAYLQNHSNQVKQDIEEMFGHFPVLRTRINQRAGTLSGGEQQMLAIARALMSRPTILLMDEPSMGLSPVMVEEIARIIEGINDRGRTIVLVEQNAAMAFELAHKCYVVENGRITVEGEAQILKNDGRIRNAYLGGQTV